MSLLHAKHQLMYRCVIAAVIGSCCLAADVFQLLLMLLHCLTFILGDPLVVAWVL